MKYYPFSMLLAILIVVNSPQQTESYFNWFYKMLNIQRNRRPPLRSVTASNKKKSQREQDPHHGYRQLEQANKLTDYNNNAGYVSNHVEDQFASQRVAEEEAANRRQDRSSGKKPGRVAKLFGLGRG